MPSQRPVIHIDLQPPFASPDAAMMRAIASEYRLVVGDDEQAASWRAAGVPVLTGPADASPDIRISDRPVEAADAFALHVLTPTGLGHLDALPADRLLMHTLADALRWVRAHPEPRRDLARAIADGAAALRRGELVAFPTETVYGLGANALDPEAVEGIFQAKQRPFHDPLIVHLAEATQLPELVTHVPDAAMALIDAFWPGPLTLVLPKRPTVADIVTAGQPTVAVRMTANPWAQALIDAAGVPVAAPSANLFGRTSPTTAAHVREQLGEHCAAIIDAGACRVGVESTVLSLVEPTPRLLRHGGVSRQQLEAVIGPIRERDEGSDDTSSSPGMLPSHYAPQTPLELCDDPAARAWPAGTGLLLLAPAEGAFAGPVEVLSQHGDLREAAINLYAALRRLDALGLRRIVAQRVPPQGLGSAINDRLTRASRRD